MIYSKTNEYNPKPLREIAYNIIVEQYGTKAHDIKVGTKYMIINNEEQNYIPLGKCLENNFEFGHPCDPSFKRTLKFELNMGHPLLKTVFYGSSNLSIRVNIIEDDEDEDINKIITPPPPPL